MAIDVIAEVKELGLPTGELVVVAGGAIAARGLKETQDVDLVVSQRVYASLREQEWPEKAFSPTSVYLSRSPFDVMTDWDSAADRPNLDDLLADSEMIDGVAIVNLERVLQWKRRMNRPKDKRDIELLEQHLSRTEGGSPS